jgi:hypothetical protein
MRGGGIEPPALSLVIELPSDLTATLSTFGQSPDLRSNATPHEPTITYTTGAINHKSFLNFS